MPNLPNKQTGKSFEEKRKWIAEQAPIVREETERFILWLQECQKKTKAHSIKFGAFAQ